MFLSSALSFPLLRYIIFHFWLEKKMRKDICFIGIYYLRVHMTLWHRTYVDVIYNMLCRCIVFFSVFFFVVYIFALAYVAKVHVGWGVLFVLLLSFVVGWRQGADFMLARELACECVYVPWLVVSMLYGKIWVWCVVVYILDDILHRYYYTGEYCDIIHIIIVL